MVIVQFDHHAAMLIGVVTPHEKAIVSFAERKNAVTHESFDIAAGPSLQERLHW
jgi:hypothetical protein